MRPFIVAALLIDIATEHSKDAKDRYQRVVDTWGRPGCQAVLRDKVEVPTADVVGWFEAAAKGTAYEPRSKFMGDLMKRHRNASDVKHLTESMGSFIEDAFNRRREKKVIMPAAGFLCAAVMQMSAGQYLEEHPEFEVEREFNLGDRVWDSSAYLDGVSDDRLHRKYTKAFKHFNFKLTHERKLRDAAWYWYQCRVVYSGPEEFCIKHQLNTGIELLPSNISKEILLGDVATGYPRKGSARQSEAPDVGRISAGQVLRVLASLLYKKCTVAVHALHGRLAAWPRRQPVRSASRLKHVQRPSNSRKLAEGCLAGSSRKREHRQESRSTTAT